MPEKKRKIITGVLTAATAAAFVLCFCFIPPLRKTAENVIAVFSEGDFTKISGFISSYGPYAAAVSFFLMIFQSLAAPLPAFLLAFANSALFGFFKGFLLTYTSSLAAASVCFFIARSLGRDAVSKLTGKAGLSEAEKFFEKHGGASVLIARLLPFISFDVISYVSGLTSISFKSFIAATAIGELPATLIYCYAGGLMTGGTKKLVYALMIMFAFFTLAVLIKRTASEKQEKN